MEADTANDGSRAYGRATRLLHRLVLGYAPLGELLLDLDSAFCRPDTAAISRGRHLFIAGLPRCGSSALLRRLYTSGAFVSPTYRDMPFVLAPALWRTLEQKLRGKQRSVAPRPRAHGDGLAHDYDTPESFEEVLWQVMDAHAYKSRERLLPHDPTDEVGNAFLRFIGVLLASRGNPAGRYLSKNNSNILRLSALRSLLPESLLVVPFRDPLQQARSLWQQHERALAAARADPFVSSYMGWLGHHAFGPVRRHYDLRGSGNPYPPSGMAHWLWVWNQVYSWLLEYAPSDTLFVAYEDLCGNPATWERLALLAGLANSAPGHPFVASIIASDSLHTDLAGSCVLTYTRLHERQNQRLHAAPGA